MKDPLIDKVLEGFYIRKRSDSPKLTIVVIDADDRQAASNEAKQRVAKLVGPNFFYGKVTGSSFRGGIEFQSGQRTVRLVFKEASSSKMGMNTALMEAAQCVYLAAAIVKRGPIDSNYVRSNVNKIRQHIDISSQLDAVLNALDDSWRKSSEIIANHVYPRLRHNNYVFHHDSNQVRKIYATYSRLNRETKTFSQSDKWNPADIWAIRRGLTINFDKVGSFDELNQDMREMIDRGDLLPISLKKVSKSAKITTENTNEAIAKAASAGKTVAAQTEFVAARVSTGKTNWMSSKNCKIEMSKGKMDLAIELRQSRPGALVNGELKVRGTVARHGKIHIRQFERIFAAHKVRLEMPDKAKLQRESEELGFDLVQKVFDLATKLNDGAKVTMEEFREFINKHGKTDPDWLASKYEAMLVIEAFSKLNASDKQKVCEALYSQAAAANELAGPFLKVNQRL